MIIAKATGVLDVRLPGGFAVAIDARPLPPGTWRGKLVAGLVKLLTLEPSHRLHRKQVLEALWPEPEPDAAGNNLRFTRHEARKRLAAAGADRNTFLVGEGESFLLGPPEALAVDVDAFERYAAAAWRSDDPENTVLAIDRYPGDLLPEDPFEAWTESRRGALRASHVYLLRQLVDLHLTRGQGAAAVAALQRLVAAEPTDARHMSA